MTSLYQKTEQLLKLRHIESSVSGIGVGTALVHHVLEQACDLPIKLDVREEAVGFFLHKFRGQVLDRYTAGDVTYVKMQLG